MARAKVQALSATGITTVPSTSPSASRDSNEAAVRVAIAAASGARSSPPGWPTSSAALRRICTSGSGCTTARPSGENSIGRSPAPLSPPTSAASRSSGTSRLTMPTAGASGRSPGRRSGRLKVEKYSPAVAALA